MTTRARLGEILVDRGLLTDRQLETALQEQGRSGERLGQVLVRLGILDADQLSSALTEQTTRWVAAGLTAGFLAFHPGIVAARTTTAQLSVSVEVLATASVAVQPAKAAPAAATAQSVSMSCAGEPLMRVTYERAQIVPQTANQAAASSPFVPAAPAYKLNLQPLSQSLVPCGTSQKSVAQTAPAVQLHGDDMNVEIAY